MRIGLYNLEPKYSNLALEKIRLHHLAKGDIVEDYMPINISLYDKIYCSSIFVFTDKSYVFPEMICGGTGFNLTAVLPEEIDKIKPHLNFGFTTRGCIRKCEFCVVPKKEGMIRVEGDLLDLWDGKAELITIYDNNILALPEHFKMICEQAIKYKLMLDINQGLDARLLKKDMVQLLRSIKHRQYHFAFDNIKHYNKIEKALKLLTENGIRISTWYVLVGFDDDDTIFPRLDLLKKYKQDVFVQIFNNLNKEKYGLLARWTNYHMYFRELTFTQFLNKKNKNHKYCNWWREKRNESLG